MRERRLAALYEEIHRFAAARDRGETPLAPRVAVSHSLESRLLVLAQGLAKGTQRVTGYPYRGPRGLSAAGRRLDAFLRPLGYSIDHTDETRAYAYSTDVIPWFPGRDERERDLEPTDDEIAECWHFFEEEVEIADPDAVIVLGRVAARGFLNRYAGQRVGRKKPRLRDLAGRIFQAQVAGRDLSAVVAWHPSAAYGKDAEAAQKTYRQARGLLADRLG